MNPQRAPKLDDTAYAVLGLIALRGPSTAYEVKRALSRITSQFWAVPHVTPYRATRELERAGFLTAEQEEGGRRRRVYSLTPNGRKAFRTWFAEGTSETLTMRDPGQLRLLFAELTEPAAIRELAREQLRVYEERRATLDETAARLADDPVRASRLGPLRRRTRHVHGVHRLLAIRCGVTRRSVVVEAKPGGRARRPTRWLHPKTPCRKLTRDDVTPVINGLPRACPRDADATPPRTAPGRVGPRARSSARVAPVSRAGSRRWDRRPSRHHRPAGWAVRPSGPVRKDHVQPVLQLREVLSGARAEEVRAARATSAAPPPAAASATSRWPARPTAVRSAGRQGHCCAPNESCWRGSVCIPICKPNEQLCEDDCCPPGTECAAVPIPGTRTAAEVLAEMPPGQDPLRYQLLPPAPEVHQPDSRHLLPVQHR